MYDRRLIGQALSPLSINTPERQGLVFRTVAHKIGVYDLYAVWGLVGGETVEGPPAILTVSPPRGADGRRVLHDDWLDE
jgi:hypothetical protein